MIRAGRHPRNRSERKILNNYRAMREVREMKDQPLTAEVVLALHRAVTDGTLDDPDAAGRLQLTAEDRVEVCDAGGNVLPEDPLKRVPDRRTTRYFGVPDETVDRMR